MKKPSKKAPRRIRHSGIWHPLQTWATEIGTDPETLKKALIKTDFRHAKGQKIPFKAIRAAIYGEDYVEKLRGMRLDNTKKLREEKLADGSLVPWELVEREQVLFTAEMISIWDSAPDEVTRDFIDKVVKPHFRKKLTVPRVEK
jgi:hypothetical protein